MSSRESVYVVDVTGPPDSVAAPTALRHVFFVLAGLAILMSAIDTTIVAIAMPSLSSGLQAPLTWIGWTLTTYQLVQTVMLPVSGKLSDSFGRKRVFLSCVTLFALGSLLCGLAPNVGLLILFRVIQGLGGGGLLPSAVGIISDQYRENRAQAIGLLASIVPIGAIIGPNLGGFILANASWRELFFINVPIGTLVAVCLWLLLQDDRPTTRLHVDVPGLALFATSLISLMYAMTELGNDASFWRSPLFWILVVASLVLFGLFLRHVRGVAHPAVNYDLIARHPFLAANVFNFMVGTVAWGFFSFIPYYAVVRFGMGPLESGEVLTPRALAIILTSALTSIFIIRLGYRLPMVLGMGIIAAVLLTLTAPWSAIEIGGLTLGAFWSLASVLALSGIGMGLVNPSSNNAGLDLAPGRAAEFSGIHTMFRYTGGVLSIAAIVTVLALVPDQAEALSLAFRALAIILLLTIPVAFLIPDSAHARRAEARHGARAEVTVSLE